MNDLIEPPADTPTEANPEPTKPDSPFLPGTKIQYAWDSTSLGYFKTCPRLYQYIILDGWQPKGESIHLRFGSEYHQALQEYDVSMANGVAHEDAIHDIIHNLMLRTADWVVFGDSKAGKYKNRQSLVGLVVDYLDHFASDPASTYIKADGTPAVELSFRFELDWGPGAEHQPMLIDGNTNGQLSQPYLLCGHLDRVVEFPQGSNTLMVMDRKTSASTVGDYWFNQFEPNNQMTLYTIAGGIVMESPIKGVIIDAAQILLEAPNRFVRGFTYRTQDQLDEWVQDLSITLQVAESYANNDYWPQNDTACDKFGGCRFREVCSKSPSVRDRFLAADFIKLPEDERWNPLKPR